MDFMRHANNKIDISPQALMNAVWDLPCVQSEEPVAHAQGMLLIRQMIEAGADQSQLASYGDVDLFEKKLKTPTTPLIIAAANNDITCLTYLLGSPGANPNFIDPDGDTALILAAIHGHPDCVAILAHVSDPNIQDSHGRTALARALLEGDPKSVAILAPITDLAVVDFWGTTAREIAERHEHARQYIPLLDSIQERPILAAASSSHKEGEAPRPRRMSL